MGVNDLTRRTTFPIVYPFSRDKRWYTVNDDLLIVCLVAIALAS